MARIAKDFVIDHVSSHVIRCSFCTNKVRKDVPFNGDPVPRGRNPHEQTKRDVSSQATEDGWKAGVSTHDIILNFCPDCVARGKEMGMIS